MSIDKNINTVLHILNVDDDQNQKFHSEMCVPANSTPKMEEDPQYVSHLANIAALSEDAIINQSLDGVIKSCNKGSEKTFGYTSAEMIGKDISLIIPPKYMIEEKKLLKRFLNNEAIDPFETSRKTKDGLLLRVSVAMAPLKDREGKIVGFSSICRDFTAKEKTETQLLKAIRELALQNDEKEKRAAELLIANKELVLQNDEKEKRATELIKSNADLIQAESRLKEVNAELDAFTYSVAHDLRAPLRAVNSYAQILADDYHQRIDADGMQVLEIIRYNTKKMGTLIDELLSFSRLGRKEIDRTTIDLDDLTGSVLADINRSTEHHAVIKASPLPTVNADPVLLRQALFNLISNAIKYSSKKEKPVVEIAATQRKGKTVFSVKDNGAGFDMRFADKLFGVFQRLHSEKEFEGNGVGLAIVQRIIAKHGGQVWGEGKENGGATFYFTLS